MSDQPGSATASRSSRPNLLVILTDDQGRCDYSACGTPDIRTPNIDRIFKEGVEFENFLANSPVCSPSRASLLTGCYPDRVGVPGVIRYYPQESWGWLSRDTTVLPQLLKPAGYHCAIVGKWHLGLEPPNVPNDRGFDFFHGFLGDMMDDYWTHLRHGVNFMRRDREVVNPEGHATDIFTEWACSYLEERAKSRQSFFLYLAYNAPHGPIQPPPDWHERVMKREPGMDPKRQKLVALIEHMDAGVGRVLDTLKRTRLEDNTMVVFLSDNGGVLSDGANNGPWRAGKCHVYEGGLRVPCGIRWPGRIKAGSGTERYALTMDLYPTLAEAAGVKPNEGIDGLSLLPALTGANPPEPVRDFYFLWREGGMYGGKTIDALRRGHWKILQDSPYAPRELYDLAADPRETTDLAKKEVAKFRDLAAALMKHIQRGGQVPWQAPFDKCSGRP